VPGHNAASDKRVIHLPREVIAPEKNVAVRVQKKREEQREFSLDFTDIIRTTGKSVSPLPDKVVYLRRNNSRVCALTQMLSKSIF